MHPLNRGIICFAGRYLAAVSQNSALRVNTVEGLVHSMQCQRY